MAEGTYVKLSKEQDSFENIIPGELHQPVDVHQVYTYFMLYILQAKLL